MINESEIPKKSLDKESFEVTIKVFIEHKDEIQKRLVEQQENFINRVSQLKSRMVSDKVIAISYFIERAIHRSLVSDLKKLHYTAEEMLQYKNQHTNQLNPDLLLQAEEYIQIIQIAEDAIGKASCELQHPEKIDLSIFQKR